MECALRFAACRLFTLLIVFSVITMAASSLAAQPAVVQDSFYTGAQTVDIELYLDSLGILPRPGMAVSQLQAVLNQYGLTFVRQLEEGLVLFSLPSPMSRAAFFDLALRIEKNESSTIGKAGPMLRSNGGVPVMVSNQIIVRFHGNATSDQMDSVNAENRTRPLFRTPYETNHFLMRVTEEAAGDALRLAQIYHESILVVSAYPDFFGGATEDGFTPNDALFQYQWHLKNEGVNAGKDIQATDAWEISQGDPGVVIAIVESQGFDATHPDLAPNLWQGPGGVYGWDFGGCAAADPNTTDLTTITGCGEPDSHYIPREHPTAVAGLAAAVGDNQIGVTGVCPRCRLMLLRTGSSTYGKTLAFLYARATNADVINASWSQKRSLVPDVETAIVNAVASGIPVVFSVGNLVDGEQQNACEGDHATLAGIPQVITVGSSNNEDQRVPGGWGSCLDVLAPGAKVTTTDARSAPDPYSQTGGTDEGYNDGSSTVADCPLTDVPDGAYTCMFEGTSAAAPVVSGILGLLLSEDPSLSPPELKSILQTTAEKIPHVLLGQLAGVDQSPYDVAGFSPTHGYGRVNAFCALRAVVAPDEPCEVEPPPPAISGKVEVGTRLGITTLSATNDQVVVNGPGSGPMAAPVFYADWFPGSNLMLEAQLGFSNTSNSGSTPDERSLVGALQPAYLFYTGSAQLFVGPSVAVQYLDIGGVSNTDYAFGAAFGYRFRPKPFLAIRLEGRYRYWTNQHIHEAGLAIGLGVVLN